MKKVAYLLLFFSLILFACQSNGRTTSAPPSPSSAPLGEPFTLRADQETTIDDSDLTLKFEAVLEDSRCPTNVECFWTGQARILITAQEGDQDPVALEFNTNPAPGQTVDTLTVNDYTIQLEEVVPYPEDPDTPIPFSDYQVTVIVTRP